MDPVPRFSHPTSNDSTEVSAKFHPYPIDHPYPVDNERNWRRFLRPRLVENAVLASDILLILIASIFYDATYHWIALGAVPKGVGLFGPGIIMAINFTAIMFALQDYRLKNLVRVTKQFWDTIVVWCGVYALLAVVGFTMKVSGEFSRGSAILFFACGLATLLSSRILVAKFITHSLASGRFARKSIIVIAERNKNTLSEPLIELRRCGYIPVKTYEITRHEITSPGITGSLSSKLAEAIQLARQERVEDVYLLIGWHQHRIIDGILDALAVLPVNVHLVPDEGASRYLKNPTANIGDAWTAVLRRAPLSYAERAAKRCFDLGLAIAGLLTLMPLMLITAILIKLDSSGPIFFLQARNGFNGQIFNIFKFRTMYVHEDGALIRQATRNDKRVTRLGRWLRKSSVDEVPQLFNVILGNMSLVGPRPHATIHNSEFEKLIANYAFRHHVKPGLTGWAQVNGYRGETCQVEQMQRRVEHDLWYINNWSPLLDLRIVLKTVVVTLQQSKAY